MLSHFPSPPGSVRAWAHEGALLLGGCGENRPETGSVTRAVWEQQPRCGWACCSDLLSPSFSFRAPLLLSTGQPHVPTFPVIQPIIQGLFSKQGLPASPSAAHGPHRHPPSRQEVWLHSYEPSVSTWVTQMSTPCTTWCGYVGPSRPVIPQLHHSSSFLLLGLSACPHHPPGSKGGAEKGHSLMSRSRPTLRAQAPD